MNKKTIIISLVIALAVAALLSPFASSFPDGLEKVAEKLGFIEKGENKEAIKSPLTDYQIPGVKNEKISTSLAGVGGTIIVFVVTYGLAKLIYKKRKC